MFKPSKAQQNYFDWIISGCGSAILEAVAGSGKTTTLIEGLRFMQGRVLLCAYNTKIANELKDRVAGMVGQVEACTMHSYGMRSLRNAFRNIRFTVDKFKVSKIFENMCKAQGLGGREEEMRLYNRALNSAVCATVSMAKQRGIGALTSLTDERDWYDMIAHYGLDESLTEEYTVDQLVAVSKQVLIKSNEVLETIDFDDMIYLPLQRKVRFVQFDWVAVDEVQDMNPTRRALAKAMLAPGGRFVGVGDPHQAIYGFTGADNDSIERIARDFDCTHLPLTVSFRCPKRVVAHAQQWVSHITAHESAPEGDVRQIDYLGAIAAVKPKDAMLCRYNAPLVRTCFKLIRMGKPAKIEGRSIGKGLIAITNKWKVKNLDALSARLETWAERETQKALDAKKEDVADRIEDQHETLKVLIARCFDDKKTTVDELHELINSLFDDNTNKLGCTILCSVHKSKGMEWDNVYLLGRDRYMPSHFAVQDWQLQQETNLIYVAVTRAKKNLFEVEMPAKDE